MAKIGRNQPCPCGSGNKFKKCCASRGITIPSKANDTSTSEQILMKTLTDEFFQPMRLYYTVHDRPALENHLKKLKCVLYDENLNDWVVNYIEEAAQIKLNVAPNKVPKAVRPLVIATIYIDNENTMLIDVRSIERAEKIIQFINQYIPKTVAEIKHAAIYNQLITATRNNPKDIVFDDIFNQENITVVDPEQSIQESNKIAAQYEDKEERINALLQKAGEDARKPLPKVEKFPVHYYEDGIVSFKTACSMRQTIAMQHYLGHEDYTFYDLLQGIEAGILES